MSTEKESPEQELARIRSERAQLEAQRAARGVTVAEQLEAERLALANEQAIAKAEDAHGPLGKRIQAIDTDLGVVIVQRPDHIRFKRFQDSADASTAEFYKLVVPCLVHPKADRFDAMLQEQPAILARVATQVCVLAGVRLKENAGKS